MRLALLLLCFLFSVRLVSSQEAGVDFGAVAFISTRDGVPKLYFADDPGTIPRLLTDVTLPEETYLLSASATGTWLAISGGESSVLVNIKTSEIRDLDYLNIGDILWSPTADQVVFTARGSASQPTALYFLDIASGKTQAFGSGDHDNDGPVWSPDGQQVAYVSYHDQNSDIYIADIRTGKFHNVSDHPASDRSPIWSPDGTRMAFVSEREGNRDLFVLALATGETLKLTDGSYRVNNVHWSPDGTMLMFITSGEFVESWLVDATGDDVRSLVDFGLAHAADALWSLDGTRLALYLGGDGGGQLAIMDVTTGDLQRLDGYTLVERRPAWSPDGTWVLFTSGQAETGLEVYALDVATFTLHNLSNHPQADYAPVWLPG